MTGRSVYLLADASGSTARGGFAGGWRTAEPRLVALAERGGHRICFLSYADEATLRVPLTPASDLVFIPEMRAYGLSSLAAGLRLLAGVVDQDRRQLSTDGIPTGRAVAVVVADGLPTDRDDHVLAARDALGDGTDLHLAVPPGEDRLALAGLRARLHPIPANGAEEVATSITKALAAALGGSPQ
jgi:Mg-chelatase subunit ChlD